MNLDATADEKPGTYAKVAPDSVTQHLFGSRRPAAWSLQATRKQVGARVRAELRAGATAPLLALRRTAADSPLLRLQLAFAAVMVASWSMTVALSVAAYDAGGTGAVALAVLARTLPGAVTGPFVGALVDRLPRRRSLVATACMCAAGSAGAAVAGTSVATAVAMVAVVSVGTMGFRTALSATLPELVEDAAELTAANVLVSSVEALGVFIGPALAGALLAIQGPTLAFSSSAGLFVVAGLLLARWMPRRAHAPARPGVRRPPARDVLRLPSARLLLALVLAQTVVSGGVVTLYPALAVGPFNADLSAVGVLTAAFGLGGVLGSLCLFALAGSQRLGLLTCVALLLWSIPLIIAAAVPHLVPVLFLLALVGGGNVLFDVTSVTLLQRAVPRPLLGRAFGALETVVVIGLGVGAAAAAGLTAALGPVVALVVLAAPLALIALAAARELRRLDRDLKAPSEQVAALREISALRLLLPLELERLALRLRRVQVAPGEAVVEQGSPGRTYYLVAQGLLDVTVDGAEVSRIGVGEGFGEIAVLHGGVRTATVRALVPSALWSLDGEVLLAALHADGGRSLEVVDAVAADRLARAAPRSGP